MSYLNTTTFHCDFSFVDTYENNEALVDQDYCLKMLREQICPTHTKVCLYSLNSSWV